MSPGPAETGDVDLRIVMARVEAKIDVSIAQHGAKLEQHGQQIGELVARVERIEDRPVATPEAILDHEARIRTVERTPTVSPRQLGATVVAVLASLGALSPFLDRFYT